MKNKTSGIFAEIAKELKHRKKDEPHWPDHVAAQAGKVNAAAGNLMHSCLYFKYLPSNLSGAQFELWTNMRRHALITIAESIRFLENLTPAPDDVSS